MTNEITAIPDLLDQLAETKQLEGALVTIDAMGCQVEIADKIVAHKADYLLPLKGNQPTLEADVEDYFRTAPADELVSKTTVEGTRADRDAHLQRLKKGRLDNIREKLSGPAALQEHQDYPQGPRTCKCRSLQLRYPPLYLVHAARYRTHRQDGAGIGASRACIGCSMSNSRRLSRYRTGHGAKNMTIVRRFALGLVRANKAKGSVKTRRKTAGWSPDFLLEILQLK